MCEQPRPGPLMVLEVPRLAQISNATRDRSRRVLTAGLRRIPDQTFARLRTSYSSSPPTSTAHRVQRTMLEVFRYRGVPSDLDFFVLPDNPSVRIANADSFIVEWLYWFGERHGYEPATIRWWKEFCGSSSRIVELGSNIGYYIIQGARHAPDGRYTAVEPHPGCAALCRRNLELNGITNAEVVEAAAVAVVESDTVELVLPGGRDHYLQAPCTGFVGVNDVHNAAEDRSSFSAVTVPAIGIASLIDGETQLIKMDVEGQEHILLSAVVDQLKESQPTIFVELLDATPHLRTLILDELMPAGYRCFVPTIDALVPLSETDISGVSLARDYGTRDIILTASASVPPHVTIA